MLCKIWGFYGGDYEECRLLGYKTPVLTSQETHYVSATELSRLMLCKIWGLHGGDYEEWRLPGYKNPVCTSQETHYISAIEHSRLMLYKIWGFHGGDYVHNSDLLMRWPSLFLAYQRLNSGSNLWVGEVQNWFNSQAVPVFRFLIDVRCLCLLPGYAYPRLKSTALSPLISSSGSE
jgi:hypothetical protein